MKAKLRNKSNSKSFHNEFSSLISPNYGPYDLTDIIHVKIFLLPFEGDHKRGSLLQSHRTFTGPCLVAPPSVLWEIMFQSNSSLVTLDIVQTFSGSFLNACNSFDIL